ncbi:MAG: two-component histidine kinase [Gemmatimonadetes bacterium]|nr:two-component histidine kinase [Gemmatimonadota bacterium]
MPYPPRHLIALAVATAFTALALALAAWLVPRGRERRAQAALADYASYFVATVLDHGEWELTRTLQARLMVPSRARMFAAAGAPVRNAGVQRAEEDGLPSLAHWVAASDRADEGAIVPVVAELLRFRYDERVGALEVAESNTLPSVRRWLADTLRRLPRRYGAAPTFLTGRRLMSEVLYPGLRGPGLGVAVRAVYAADGSRVLYGYVGELRPLLAIAIPDMVARTPLFPQSLRRVLPNHTLVALTIATTDGVVIFRDAADVAGRTKVALTFANAAFGGVRVTLTPNTDVAALLSSSSSDGAGAVAIPALSAVLLTLLAFMLAHVWVARRESALTAARLGFLAAVSHEFRTPLAQILVAADTLPLLAPGAFDPPEARTALGAIVHGAERLGHLVDNVLHVARGDRPDPTQRLEPLQLAPLVEDVVERFLPVASEADVCIAVDLAADVVVNANRELLTRILLNLLDNAVKYGARPQTVVVSLTRCDDRARLTVDDEGPGVPAADRERVWEPFTRLARDAAQTGSGIGLTVVRDLTRSAGGTVNIESAPGGGARFVVELPLARGLTHGTASGEAEIAP